MISFNDESNWSGNDASEKWKADEPPQETPQETPNIPSSNMLPVEKLGDVSEPSEISYEEFYEEYKKTRPHIYKEVGVMQALMLFITVLGDRFGGLSWGDNLKFTFATAVGSFIGEEIGLRLGKGKFRLISAGAGAAIGGFATYFGLHAAVHGNYLWGNDDTYPDYEELSFEDISYYQETEYVEGETFTPVTADIETFDPAALGLS